MKRRYVASENLDAETKARVEKELILGYLNLSEGFFDQAQTNFEVALKIDEKCADAWWGMMLSKFQISNENSLYDEPVKYKSVLLLTECQKALECANDAQKNIYADLLERINKINEGDNY